MRDTDESDSSGLVIARRSRCSRRVSNSLSISFSYAFILIISSLECLIKALILSPLDSAYSFLIEFDDLDTEVG